MKLKIPRGSLGCALEVISGCLVNFKGSWLLFKIILRVCWGGLGAT